MDAVVTLKLTPAEFDLLRDAIETTRANAEYHATRTPSDPDFIDHARAREAKAKAVKLTDVLNKLR